MYVDHTAFKPRHQTAPRIDVATLSGDVHDADIHAVIGRARSVAAHVRSQVPKRIFDLQDRAYDVGIADPTTYLETMEPDDYRGGYEAEAVSEFNRQIALIRGWAERNGIEVRHSVEDFVVEPEALPVFGP